MKLTHHNLGTNKIILVDKRNTRGGVFHDALDMRIRDAVDSKENMLIIGTKAHFASGMTCKDCGHIPHCKHCDLAIAWHKDLQGQLFGLCHLCKTYYPASNSCPQCQGHEFDTYGQGLQQLADICKKSYNLDGLLVDRSVANSVSKLTKLMPQIQEKQLILSTTLLTQAPRNKQFGLVIVTHADLGLQSPDLGAARQNFCFLSEILSKYKNTEIRLHAYNPEHPSIQYAVTGNKTGMQQWLDDYNKRFCYPPYTQLCVIMYKHEVEERLYTTVNKLYQELLFLKVSYQQENLEIYSTPPLIYKAFGKFRYHIVLKGEDLRNFMEIAYSKLKMRSRGFKVDWEPQNLI